ncbi:MAG TPA: hypothetical protein VM888_06450 [Chitinophagaceae bacterium]|nr:hypothetical protein [Chitinophagaceae bacterium]
MTQTNTIISGDDEKDLAFFYRRILKRVDLSKLLFTATDEEVLFDVLKTVTLEYLFLDLYRLCTIDRQQNLNGYHYFINHRFIPFTAFS